MPDFKNKVAKYGGYGFTKGQEEALDELEKWYFNPKELLFTLTGRAGTGKTYILKHFVNKIVKHPICVTAPTHKAVRQVEKSTGKKGKTLQSLHGLRPNINLEDFDLNNVKFDALGNPTFNNYKIVVIDECSMVNKDLHALNLRRAKDIGTKILYVGDLMQIPPVNRGNDANLMESPTFNLPMFYELNEIVRQDSDNPLINLLEIIVKDIKAGTSYFVKYLIDHPFMVNSNGEGYKVHKNPAEFLNTATEYFKSADFGKDPDYARIASWKNKTVDAYNNEIRTRLIKHFNGEDAKQELIDINDLLIGYKTLTNEFNETTLINSEDYVIDNVVDRFSDSGFKTYAVTISPRHGGVPTNVHIVDHRDESFLVYYDKIRLKYFNALYDRSSNRSSKWRDYFDYKNQYLTLVTFPIKEGDVEKVHVTKDIDYAFSLTVHKLQGSTIQNVFVDLNDMLFYSTGKVVENSKFAPNAAIMRNKLIYTAISRTSKMCHIYLNL